MPTVSFMSPISLETDSTLWLISYAWMSAWITFTFLLKRGAYPKCKIQFNLAPKSITTSAYFNAKDLAALTFKGWESGITPFPIGVGKNGIFTFSMNSLTYFSALPYAAPLPTMISGFLANPIILIAFFISEKDGQKVAGWVKMGIWISPSTISFRTLPGRSRKTGPGLPVVASLTALLTWYGISFADVILTQYLV